MSFQNNSKAEKNVTQSVFGSPFPISGAPSFDMCLPDNNTDRSTFGLYLELVILLC